MPKKKVKSKENVMVTRVDEVLVTKKPEDAISSQLAKSIVESTEYTLKKERERRAGKLGSNRSFLSTLMFKLLLKNPKFWGKFFRASEKDVYMFAKQLSLMLGSGLNYHRAFSILFEQSQSPKIKYMSFYVLAGISRGERLAKLLLEFSSDLGEYFVGVVAAGERTGTLAESLSMLADTIEKQINIKHKVKSALSYPMLVIFFGIGITFFLFRFVLPNIFKILESSKAKLPFYTIALMNFTNFLANPLNIVYLILGIALIYLAFLQFIKTPIGRTLWENVRMRLPIYGRLNRLYISMTFLRIFAVTLEAGLPLLTSLEIAKRATKNKLLDMIVDWAKTRLKEGARFSDIFGRYSFKASPGTELISPDEKFILSMVEYIFPSLARGLINVGDHSGDLVFPIMKYIEFAETEIDRTLETISSIIEPLLIVLLGLMVGFILVAVMMPMYQMVSSFSQ